MSARLLKIGMKKKKNILLTENPNSKMSSKLKSNDSGKYIGKVALAIKQDTLEGIKTFRWQ